MDNANKATINIMGRKSLKIFFTEAKRPTAYIFSMLQWLVVSYINPANQVPGVKTCHTLGMKSSHRLIVGKTKNYSLKPYIFSI